MQVVFKILSVVLIAAAGLFPQVNELKFQKISVEQGLSQSVVVSILQDTRGFLWFATQDGLNRYDGYDFSIFKHSPSDSTTISDNYATFILQDKNGIHWVGTNGGGLNKFDVRSEKFTAFKNQAGDKRSLSNNNIRFMFEDANGNFWIATYGGGLNKLDRKHLIFTSYKNDARNPLSIADDRVFCVAGDNNNNLWIGTENGLDFFNPETGNFFHFKNKKENKFGLSSNFIRSLMVDENNLLYIGTDNGGLNILNLNEFYNLFNNNPQTAVDKIKFSVYKNSPKDINSIGGNSVNYIIKDKFGRIWLGLWAGGLSLFDQSKKIFSRYNYNPSNPNSLSQDDIITIYEDRTGIIWIGTYSGGISKLDRSWESFKLFRHDPNIPGSLSHNRVFAILQDKFGDLWVGTWGGGLNRYNKKENRFEHFTTSGNINSLNDNRVNSLYVDKMGTLWVGTLDGGLNKFDYSSNSFINSRNSKMPPSLSKGRITTMLEDSRGNFWVGTLSNGLILYDRIKATEKSFVNNPDDSTSISNSRITSIFEDSRGTLWIGTYFGLNILDRRTGKFTHFKKNQSDPSSLKYDRISKITEDRTGTIWIGTSGGGLYRLDKNEREKGRYVFKVYNRENGLADDFIYNIIVEKNNSLWITTNNGLNVFNPVIGVFSKYDAADGLQSNEFKEGSYYDEVTGEMFVGGINGFNSFYPERLKINPFPPQPALTGFKIFNEPVKSGGEILNKSSISYAKEITLSYKDYFFTIDFSALHYSSPEENKYAYYLEGFDRNWIYTTARHRYAAYTNLSGGTYTFYVKAANPDGIWTKEPIALKINIIPPFYQTIIFNIIMLIAILLLLAAGVNWKTSRIKKQNKLLEKEVEKRTKELRELNATKDKFFSIIAHDLKGPFNFFLGSTSLLKEDINNLSKDEIKQIGSTLNSAAHKFYKLLDNLLAWARVQMGVLKPEPDNFVLLNSVNDIIKLMSDTAIKKEIEIKCNCNQIENVSVYADENMIGTVLRNLISNALKFTRKGGKVTVDFSKSENKLFISINDTGVGMSEMETENIFNLDKHRSQKGTENEEGAGLGLILCKEFIEKNGGTFEIKSEPNIGTTAIFSVPLSK